MPSYVSYNLVIVKGSKQDIAKFKKSAFENESRAFCFEKLLPIPENIKSVQSRGMSDKEYEWRIKHYDNKWGDGFSIIFDEKPEEIHYYFNSHTYPAKINKIAELFPELIFTHIFMGGKEFICGITEFIDGNEQTENNLKFSLETFEWNIVTDFDTPAYIVELHCKISELRNKKKDKIDELYWEHEENVDRKEFYSYFSKKSFVKNNKEFLENLLTLEDKLWERELKFAKEIASPIKINSAYYRIKFFVETIGDEKEAAKLVKEFIRSQKNSDYYLSDDYFDIINYVMHNLDLEDEIINFANEYVDFILNKTNEYIANFNAYCEMLSDYKGITPACKYSGENFIHNSWLYGWIIEEKYNEYNNKEYVPTKSNYDECKEYQNQLVALKGNNEAIKIKIAQREEYEKLVKENYEFCRIKFKNENFYVYTDVMFDANGFLEITVDNFENLFKPQVKGYEDLPF